MPRGDNGGRKPGQKSGYTITDKVLAQRRAAARRPRRMRPRSESESVVEMRLRVREDMLKYLHGPLLKRIRARLARVTDARVLLEAYRVLGDRFGLPPMTEQTVRMEGQQAPKIIFEQRGFERPGSVAVPASTNGHATNGNGAQPNGNGTAH
jgi:hypothetical protein